MLKKDSKLTKIAIYLVCAFLLLLYIAPLYMLVNLSVRVKNDFSSFLTPTKDPQLKFLISVITDPSLWKSMGNTVIYAALNILFLIPIASLGGYGLARSQGWYVTMLRNVNVMVMMIPGTALLVGTYSLMVDLKLTNSLVGLALLGAGGGMTGCMFFYTAFCASIPRDLDEAAELDGAGVIRTFFLIIFPQMKAITITRIISIVIGCWNSYLMPMYLLTKKENYTVLLYVRVMFNTTKSELAIAMSACLLMLVPILIFYFFSQRYIIGGQIDSSVKG